MQIKFEKSKELKGRIVFYNGFMEYSETKDFDELHHELTKKHKHKVKLTEAFSSSIQLYYSIEDETITVSNARLSDAYSLSKHKNEVFKLLNTIQVA